MFPLLLLILGDWFFPHFPIHDHSLRAPHDRHFLLDALRHQIQSEQQGIVLFHQCQQVLNQDRSLGVPAPIRLCQQVHHGPRNDQGAQFNVQPHQTHNKNCDKVQAGQISLQRVLQDNRNLPQELVQQTKYLNLGPLLQSLKIQHHHAPTEHLHQEDQQLPPSHKMPEIIRSLPYQMIHLLLHPICLHHH